MPYVPRKSRYTKRTKPASFATRVRKIISSTAQLKHASNSANTSGMDSDVMYFTSPTQNIAQGTAINQRIGDQVKLKYLKVNGFFVAANSANAHTKFRVSVFYSPEDNAAASVTASAFTSGELFLPNTAGTNSYGIYDEKAVTVLADLTIDLNSIINTSEDLKSFAFSVPLKNVKANYVDSGSTFCTKKNLYIMVMGYTAVGANIANVGTFSYSYDLGFNDI